MNYRDQKKRMAVAGGDGGAMNDATVDLMESIIGASPRNRNRMALPDNAIVPGDDGTLGFRAFRLTRVGLQSSDASEDDWLALVDFLRQVEGSLQWLLGDAIVMGEKVYGRTYEQITELTGLAIKTLYDYAYVAANVEFSVRTENLSFGHHKLVAALPPDEQCYWLEQAVANRWAINDLRKALSSKDGGKKRDPFDTFANRQISDARKLDRPALATRISQLEELVIQMKSIMEKKRS